MAGTRHGQERPAGLCGLQLRPAPYQTVQTDSLWSDDAYFPMEPGLRLQIIGRVTDQMAIEATYWGLQQWSVGRTIFGDGTARITAQSAWLSLPNFNNSLGYTYNSQVNNVEINQRFKLFSFDPYRTFSGCGAFAIST